MMDPGPVGVWTFAFDQMPIDAVRDAAAEIEALGYGAIWIGEAAGRESLTHAALLCEATERIVIASGIARVGERSPRVVRAAANALSESSGGRYLLGLGGSNQLGGGRSAVAAMADYLDEYDNVPYITPAPTEPPPVVLGAQGPAMLRLAAERSDGTHTYLVTPEHTAWARNQLGPEPFLAPEQAVIVETDPNKARTLARDHLGFYLTLPHFQANFARAGFEPDDWADGGSDQLIDALVARGRPRHHQPTDPSPPRRRSQPRLHPTHPDRARTRAPNPARARAPAQQPQNLNPADDPDITTGPNPVASLPLTDYSNTIRSTHWR